MKLPVAYQADLIVREVDNELLIYNLKTNKTFLLNQTCKNIYQFCDGKTSFEELKQKYNYSEDLVFLALDELKRNNLIKDSYRSAFAGISRREAVKKVGLATMAVLPVITAIVAPMAISAASTCVTPYCFGVGENVCAWCQGPITYEVYPAGSNCTGPVFSTFGHLCGSLIVNNSNFVYKVI